MTNRIRFLVVAIVSLVASSACAVEPDRSFEIDAETLAGSKDDLVVPLQDGVTYTIDQTRGQVSLDRIVLSDGAFEVRLSEVVEPAGVDALPRFELGIQAGTDPGSPWRFQIEAETAKRRADCSWEVLYVRVTASNGTVIYVPVLLCVG